MSDKTVEKVKEAVPLRNQVKIGLTNSIQKYRSVLIAAVALIVIVLAGLAIWSQIDSATKKDYAARIDKSQSDLAAWTAEADATKKAALAKVLDEELTAIEKNAPVSYGLLKAWYLHGNFWAEQTKWVEASTAYKTAFEKDSQSYLAPIALLNASVAQEEAGDFKAALALLETFIKNYPTNPVLAPQVYFTQGHLLEVTNETAKALVAYRVLLEKFPESNWTKLAHDRIILLGSD